MAWSPDGDLLAIAGGTDHYPYDRAPENGRDFVTIYDRQGELVTTIDALPAEFLYSIRFTADGESVILVIMAYGGFDPQVSRVEVRDWRTGDVEYTLPADAVLAIPDPTGPRHRHHPGRRLPMTKRRRCGTPVRAEVIAGSRATPPSTV